MEAEARLLLAPCFWPLLLAPCFWPLVRTRCRYVARSTGRVLIVRLRPLAIAIRSAAGIEALTWLTDIAGLSSEDAIDLMRWSARAMLHAAVPAKAATTRGPRDLTSGT